MPTFEHVLQQADLPEPGPDYYQARRRLWLGEPTDRPHHAPSLAQRKLEDMLNQPHAVYSREVWSNGLERIWRGLCSGGKLKSYLPMNLIIKIVHASWLRDGTWPAGMEAPSSDDQTEPQDPPAPASDPPPHAQPLLSVSSTDIVESTTSSPRTVARQYRSNRWR